MEKVYLTAAQMAAAAPYERNMETAVKSDWTRGLGRTGAKVLAQIAKEVSGTAPRVDLSCPDCVLTLCRRVGKWYFDTKERDAALAAAKAAAEAQAKVKIAAPVMTATKAAQQVKTVQKEVEDLAKAVGQKQKPQNTAKTPRKATNAKKTGEGPAKKKSAPKSTKKAK